jgi:hypothetical protein
MSGKDKTAPALSSTFPKKGSMSISVNQDLILTFNEEIQVGTGNIIISSGKFQASCRLDVKY